jgi:hypothetical protein
LLTRRHSTQAEAESVVDTPLVYPARRSDPEGISVRHPSADVTHAGNVLSRYRSVSRSPWILRRLEVQADTDVERKRALGRLAALDELVPDRRAAVRGGSA